MQKNRCKTARTCLGRNILSETRKEYATIILRLRLSMSSVRAVINLEGKIFQNVV